MPEPLDPKKFHTLTRKQKSLAIIAAIVFALVILPLFGYGYYTFAINRPAQSDKEFTVQITSGEGVFEISKDLYSKGAINSEFLFNIYVILGGFDKSIQAGVYKIPSGSSIVDMVNLFEHGTNDKKMTFLEGWRVEEFARAASQNFENVDYEQFIRIAAGSEGMLFPDTYYFNADVSEEAMVEALKSTFDLKTKNILTDASLQKANLTRDDAIKFASIVEREVHSTEDRPIVAGILIKRWRNGELIGADATTQYVASRERVGCNVSDLAACPTDGIAMEINWWPNDLTVAELALDSPYNTRKVVGLMPAPISSFSINALESVLNSTLTDYNFYLTDLKGVTHYAKTYDEHLSNIQMYLK